LAAGLFNFAEGTSETWDAWEAGLFMATGKYWISNSFFAKICRKSATHHGCGVTVACERRMQK